MEPDQDDITFDLETPTDDSVPVYMSEEDMSNKSVGALCTGVQLYSADIRAYEQGDLEIRSEVDEVHLDKLTQIVDSALDEILDRVKYGDKLLNRMTGETARMPLRANVLNNIIKTLMDRHDISRARIKLKANKTSDNMSELIAALKGSSRGITVIDGELLDRGDEDGKEKG